MLSINRPSLRAIWYLSAVIVGAGLFSLQAEAATGRYENGTATSVVGIVAPSENADGTPLDDLNFVTLMWGQTSSGTGLGSQELIMAAGETHSETVNIQIDPGLPSSGGTFNLYFVGTATDMEGNTSDRSNVLMVTFVQADQMPPAPPVLNGIDLVVTDTDGNEYVAIASREVKKRGNVFKRLFKRNK